MGRIKSDPSVGRLSAQVKQKVGRKACNHDQRSIRELKLRDGWSVKFCSDCSTMLDQPEASVCMIDCVHPEERLAIRLIHSDGYIEFCECCNHVTDLYEP